MSQHSGEVVSTINTDEPPLKATSKVNAIQIRKPQATLARGICMMTMAEAARIFYNPSPQERAHYVGMLSHSPSTVAYLRAEFSKPSQDITGEHRTRILQILADAEERIDWKAILMMDA